MCARAKAYIARMDSIRATGLPFRKMHGAGNDFVIIDARPGQGSGVAALTPALARVIGDRHRGVGFDQLAVLHDHDGADVEIRFWNADGSRAGACGNATRCVADLIMAESGTERLHMVTARGDLFSERRDGAIWVNMGPPLLDPAEIPLATGADPQRLPLPGDPVAVGMGNPHCVFFVADAEAEDVATRGAAVEHDPLFPEATNVEFASLIGPDHLRLRVWERGTGITLACGSGACAAAVAAHLRGLTGRRVLVRADGGDLAVDWRDDGVWLTGPVAYVFDGVLAPEMLAVT